MVEVSEIKITDFKMLEKPPYYKLPPTKGVLDLSINAAIEQEKTYGPVFSDRYIKHALRYVA